MLSDIEIANAAVLRPIKDVAAETLGIPERHLVPYGHHKAKVDLTYLATLSRPAARPAGPGHRALPHAARRGQDHDHGGPDRRPARAGAPDGRLPARAVDGARCSA